MHGSSSKESGRRRVTGARATSVIASIDSNVEKGLTSNKLTAEVRLLRMEDEINKLRRSHDVLSVRNAELVAQIDVLNAEVLDRDRQIASLIEFRDMGKKQELLEAQLHRAVARADKAEAEVRQSRTTIADLRAERRRVERGYEKLLVAADEKDKAVDAARASACRFESELASANADLAQLMKRFEHEKARWQTETMDLRSFIEQDRSIHDLLAQRSMLRESQEKDAAARMLLQQWERKDSAGTRRRTGPRRGTRGGSSERDPSSAQDKLALVEKAFRRIQEMTGEAEIDVAVEKFVNREQVNSSMMNYVNELTAEQERQTTLVAQLRKELADFKSSDAAAGSLGGKRALAMQQRLADVEAARDRLIKSNVKMQKMLASVRTGVASIFAKLPAPATKTRSLSRSSSNASLSGQQRSLTRSNSMLSVRSMRGDMDASGAATGLTDARATTLIDSLLNDDNLLQYMGMIEERVGDLQTRLATAASGAPGTGASGASAPLNGAGGVLGTARARRGSTLLSQINKKRAIDVRAAVVVSAAVAANAGSASAGDASSAAGGVSTLRLPLSETGSTADALSPVSLLQRHALAEKAGVQTLIIGEVGDGPAAMLSAEEFERWRVAHAKQTVSRLTRSDSAVSLLANKTIETALLPSAADDEDDYDEVEVMSREEIKAAAAKVVADKAQMKKSDLERMKRAEAVARVRHAAGSGPHAESGPGVGPGARAGSATRPTSAMKRRATPSPKPAPARKSRASSVTIREQRMVRMASSGSLASGFPRHA